MIPNRPFRPMATSARAKLLEAALKLIRTQGFAGTSVDALCAEAGVTKGAFFHHFASKEALGVAAADYWSTSTGSFFDDAPYHYLATPRERVLGYVDLRMALIAGAPEAFSCVAGTMVQEAFVSSAAIRDACEESISGNAAKLDGDIAAALADAGRRDIDATSLSLHIQAVLQGSFIIGKMGHGADGARDSVAHLKRYLAMLFTPDPILN